MIYITFILWLLLTLLIAAGVHRLWSHLVKPVWVNWALLPGTIVSEMAYIFGCLITGGEIRRAKILPGKGAPKNQGGSGESEPGTQATARLGFIGPMVASLLSIVACVAAILVAHAVLGEPVIKEFIAGRMYPVSRTAELPQQLPTSWDAFWDQLSIQVGLLRRMSETCVDVEWTDWRVPLFVYLTLCLSIRLAPVGKPIRPTLTAVGVIAALLAVAAAAFDRFRGLIEDIWPLVTYVWTSLLFLLVLTLLITGITKLVQSLAGKQN